MDIGVSGKAGAPRLEGAGPLGRYDFGATLPPAFAQALAFFASVKRWPLQSFFPLQAWLAALQAPLPLQSLAPSHLTILELAPALPAKAAAGATKVASAPAMAKPFSDPFFIDFSSRAISLNPVYVPGAAEGTTSDHPHVALLARARRPSLELPCHRRRRGRPPRRRSDVSRRHRRGDR